MSSSYPILEFDPTREALTEPARLIKPRDVPEHCVICFFREVIEKVSADPQARAIVRSRWEDGPHLIYEIAHNDQRLAFFHPGVGAPLAAAFLEELHERGKEFYVTSDSGDYVRIYPMKKWRAIEDKLAAAPSYNKAKQKFLARANYYGQAVILDNQGRILIPPVLRESVGAAGRWWLHHALVDLDCELRQRGSRLIVAAGDSLEQLSRIAAASRADRLASARWLHAASAGLACRV